jgi:hypothetical protein
VEFYIPFRVSDDGNVTDVRGYVSPDVYVDSEGIPVHSDDWSTVDGYSHQYGYAGPIMHSSEYLGGAMAREVLATPGVYVLAECLPDDEDGTPDGWVLLRFDGGDDHV